jgi:hypothetical protein
MEHGGLVEEEYCTNRETNHLDGQHIVTMFALTHFTCQLKMIIKGGIYCNLPIPLDQFSK